MAQLVIGHLFLGHWSSCRELALLESSQLWRDLGCDPNRATHAAGLLVRCALTFAKDMRLVERVPYWLNATRALSLFRPPMHGRA
jgi:hypothetical protein